MAHLLICQSSVWMAPTATPSSSYSIPTGTGTRSLNLGLHRMCILSGVYSASTGGQNNFYCQIGRAANGLYKTTWTLTASTEYVGGNWCAAICSD